MSLKTPPTSVLDGSGIRVAIVAARFNQDLVDRLLERTLKGLAEAGVAEEGIELVRVPGSNEVPVAVQYLAMSDRFDACIGLGLIIRGETLHYEIIAHGSSRALQEVALNTGVPVINGIIVAENEGQAVERCGGKFDRGREFAMAAVEMGALARKFAGNRS
ncbi:MAG: 6,7-dimethyl-8-ribityllumazine synthase [Opitutaceae bacterium]